jgi:hypothetical protein
LVKDGAAAIRTLGTAIDTTVFNNASAAIAKTIVDAKGDIIAATAADTVSRLAVGANDTVLTADSSTATGLKWAAPAGGANWTLLNAGGTALTGASTITVSGISGKSQIMVVFGENVSSANASDEIAIRFNSDSGSNYFIFGDEVYYPSTYTSGMVNRQGNLTSTRIPIFQMGGSASSYGAGYIQISGANASGVKVFTSTGGANNTGNNATTYKLGGIYNSSSAISSITIFTSSGNFDSGTVYVYTSA